MLRSPLFSLTGAAGMGLSLCLLAASAPTHAQTAPAFSYRATVNKRTIAGNGKSSNEKPIVFHTIISGSRGRAEVVDGGDDDMKPGDLLLTTDAGQTVQWVSARKREYRVIDTAFKQRLSNEIASKLKLEMSNSRVTHTPPVSDGTLEGRAVLHTRLSRSTRMAGRILLMRYAVTYEDSLDTWTAKDLAGLPAVEAAFFETIVDAFTGSNPTLSTETEAAKTRRPPGLPLKWTHVSRTTKDDGEVEEKTTDIVITRLQTKADAGSVSFDVPAGYRRVEK
jgi:hypothetical protein